MLSYNFRIIKINEATFKFFRETGNGPAVGNYMNVLLLLVFTFKFTVLQLKSMIILNISTIEATIGFKHNPVPATSDLKNREQARKYRSVKRWAK